MDLNVTGTAANEEMYLVLRENEWYSSVEIMHLVVIICFPFGLDFGLSTEEARLVLNFWIEVKMREVFGVNCSRLT